MAKTVNGNAFTSKPPQDDESHQMISSLFLGPHAENYEYFKDNIISILEATKEARLAYHPEDGPFISKAVQESDVFQKNSGKIAKAVQKAAQLLGQHSVPWWNPRYAAHMCMDLSMPAVLGYFMTMLYNPNNVSIEASPLTTVAEMEVGSQLSEMVGYNIDPKRTDVPLGWGHITSGGTVANLESVWAARNLKFYPLALRNAMKDFGPLAFIANTFVVETCMGASKLLRDLTKWELLNLKVTTVLEIPDRLTQEYGISSTFLGNVMNQFGIQSVGLGELEREYGIEKPMQYMLANTRHYSWPKSGAICGLGSDHVIGIAADYEARVDIDDLRAHLEASLANQQAVYAVVAIIGSTEEGAVDPLRGILALRDSFQARGLSFVVHADAAWGSYFCTMLPKDFVPGHPDNGKPPAQTGGGEGFVPDAALRVETQEDMFAVRFADSTTVDPHKAGYIPYPAGGLCYRDERMRFLITWSSPYINRAGTTTSIGIFGVEGSKPGAAAMSTWLSNRCIGLDPQGYGALLGEVCFSISRLSAHWAAMSTPDTSHLVVPMNLLPSERDPNATPESIEAEKQKIRDQILNKSNHDLIEEDNQRPEHEKAMTLLRALGSDLNINAFAINFRYSDGTLNDDVEEANYLNRRIAETFSVDTPEDRPTNIPFFVTSTEFEHGMYGKCAQHFKKRMGLSEDLQTLFVLRNVLMSPFPTEGNFVNKMIDIFRDAVEKEVEVCRKRNETKENHHNFIMQGTDTVYLVHRSMFYLASRRRQLIASVKLDDNSMKTYQEARKSGKTLILSSQEAIDLSAIIDGQFGGVITDSAGKTLVKDVKVNSFQPIKDRPLNSKYRDMSYPSGHMPFYIYGAPSEFHVDHILVKAPNIQLSAANVKLSLDKDIPPEDLKQGCILFADGVQEAAMQPFLPTKQLTGEGDPNQNYFFFRKGAKMSVTVFKDKYGLRAGGPGLADVDYRDKIASGDMVLSGEEADVWIDSEMVNRDPFKRPSPVDDWKKEFDLIGKELE